MSQSAPSPNGLPNSPRKVKEISGSAVVIGMLVMGIAAVSLLFIYFEMHTGPFRPLREAIGREFRHSRPNVEGGRLKGRGPMILRISLSVPFDPLVEESKATEINARILDIARQHQDLTSFEQVQINLIKFIPEAKAKRRTFDFTGAGVPIIRPKDAAKPSDAKAEAEKEI